MAGCHLGVSTDHDVKLNVRLDHSWSHPAAMSVRSISKVAGICAGHLPVKNQNHRKSFCQGASDPFHIQRDPTSRNSEGGPHPEPEEQQIKVATHTILKKHTPQQANHFGECPEWHI